MKIRSSLATLAVLVLAACAPAATPPPAEDTPTSIPIELPTETASDTPEASPDPGPALLGAISGQAEVEIEDFIFGPTVITITVGTTVEWENKDNAPHTVRADDGSWGSGRLNKGGKFSYTFTQTGTYTYYCSVHPAMTGTVIVVSP